MKSLTFYLIVFLSLATARSINGISHLSLSSSDSYSVADVYNNLIQATRQYLTQNTSTLYDIPILKSSVPSNQRFVTIKLKNPSNETIALALDTLNLRVVGYLANSNSYIFLDAPPEASDTVFPPSSCRVLLGFNSDYQSIEKASGITRLQTLLGFDPLNSAISNLFHYNQDSVAKSFLVILQMVLGGVKFKLIEQSVIKSLKFGFNFKPSLGIVSLEDNWVKLSSQIQASSSLQGLFNEAIKLYDSNSKLIPVDSMYYPIIASNIALQIHVCNVSRDYIRMPGIVDGPCSVQPQTRRISGRHGYCVDDANGRHVDDNPIISYICGQQPNQKWSFHSDGTIRYFDKYCLTFDTSNYIAVIYNCSKVKGSSSRWIVSLDGTIRNPSSGHVLTAETAERSTKLKVDPNTYTNGQSWRVGNYTEPIVGSIIGMDHMCLEATNEYTSIWLEKCGKNKKEQYWGVYSDGSIRVNSKRNLCVTSSSVTSSWLITIAECKGTSNQRWTFMADGTILNPATNKVMDVEHATIALKRIILYRKNGKPNQQWALFY